MNSIKILSYDKKTKVLSKKKKPEMCKMEMKEPDLIKFGVFDNYNTTLWWPDI